MTTATKEEKVSAFQARQDLAQSLSYKQISKFIKREYIGQVEGLKHPHGGSVELVRWIIEEGKEMEQVLELTNDKGLGAVLHRSFFELWREAENEVLEALKLAEYAAEMVEDYKEVGWSNKARFMGTGGITQAQERQRAIVDKIQTALYVAKK